MAGHAAEAGICAVDDPLHHRAALYVGLKFNTYLQHAFNLVARGRHLRPQFKPRVRTAVFWDRD